MVLLTNSKLGGGSKNKAFTLIELLAVIVILAIIALVSTPIILNILYKVRKSAFQDSAYGILSSGKMYYADMVLNDNVTEQTFFFDGENRPNLEYAGEIPKGGVLQISADGEIALALHNNEWCAVKGKDEDNIRMIKYKSGKCIIPDGNNKPMITLNGDKTVYIEINGSYKEEGAIARTSAGEELEYTIVIKHNDTVVTSIDTSVEATYKITYTVTSETENTVSETRTVVVTTDTVEPTLTVENYNGKVGDNVELSNNYMANFGEKGGSVTCKYGSTEITNVNHFKEEGTYTISCIAHGLNGKNSGLKTMTITLKDSTLTATELVKDNPDVATDDPDGNPRFVGSNPKNYVSFNGELYRIIGVFKEQMKLIKDDFYSTSMAWDSNSNNWSTASLMTELNTTYWRTINSTYQNMIDQNHTWKLGGWDTSDVTRSEMYEKENGTTVYEENPTEWIGKIALMYPSDYAYATNGGSTCDSAKLSEWNNETTKAECSVKSWLHSNLLEESTLMSVSTVSYSKFVIFYYGSVGQNYVWKKQVVRPTFYLKPDVKITGGKGTSDEPYILGM